MSDTSKTFLWIPRQSILKTAKDRLEQSKSWASTKHYDYAFHLRSQAEVLIELLEEADCGSTGGFADKVIRGKRLYQHEIYRYHKDLEGRLRWLELEP